MVGQRFGFWRALAAAPGAGLKELGLCDRVGAVRHVALRRALVEPPPAVGALHEAGVRRACNHRDVADVLAACQARLEFSHVFHRVLQRLALGLPLRARAGKGGGGGMCGMFFIAFCSAWLRAFHCGHI